MKISKQDFHAYETVRLSGVTNMYHLTNVENLSGLTKLAIRNIQLPHRYEELVKQYGVPASVKEAAEEMRSEYA